MFERSSEGVSQLNLENIFTQLYGLMTGSHDTSGVTDVLRSVWDTANFISIFAVPILLFGIIYVSIRMWQFHHEEREKFEEEVRKVHDGARGDGRWDRIVDLVSSDNPTEWRHGVIEADVLLDELLTERGYVGETLGEKLKNTPKDQMKSLNEAWEAHKVRNEIAHAGSDFILTQREARRAIDMYRKVFEEINMS